MSLEDTIERPQPTLSATSPDGGAGRWSLMQSDPRIAQQAHWPIVTGTDSLLFAYGGDGGQTVLRSNDGGASWTALTADYPPRSYPSGLTHAGYIWLIGGDGKSDCQVSTNGSHWAPRGGQGPWGPRMGHSVLSYQGFLFLMGGIVDQRPATDVWALPPTLDQWTLVKADAFTGRLYCASAVIDGKMVLMGGNGDSGPLAEVLVSINGQTWQRYLPPWTGRWGAVATVLGDTLYLIGGKDAADRVLNEVWTTRDAITWTQVDSLPAALDEVGVGAMGQQVVALGGLAAGQPNPQAFAYNPSDGWIEIGQDQEAGYLNYPGVARLGSTTYALDGSPQTPVVASDYERIWTPVAGANLPYRRQAAACTLDGKLWVSGGEAGGLTSDIYSSPDGRVWTADPQPMWAPRKQHAMVAFEDTLFVIGGATVHEPFNSEVFYKADGGWIQERVGMFQPRRAATAVAFNGRLWLLGGQGSAGPIGEALRREDNLTWTSIPVPWAPRYSFAAGVIDGLLYVALGQGVNGPLTDTWVTPDGQTWTQVARPPGPALRESAGWVVHDGAILSVGGARADGQPNTSVRRFLPPR